MFKAELTYTDENGIPHENTPEYFNLTKLEATEYLLTVAKDPVKLVEEIIGAEDMLKVLQAFKTLIKMSYGQRLADGRWRKSEEAAEDFLHTEACSAFLEKLINDADYASAFINGIFASAKMSPEKQEIYDKAMSSFKQVK